MRDRSPQQSPEPIRARSEDEMVALNSEASMEDLKDAARKSPKRMSDWWDALLRGKGKHSHPTYK